MITTSGWAVIEGGKINVRSIGPTRVSAMVNFLCTERKVVVAPGVTDAAVTDLFLKHRRGAVARPVKITAHDEEPERV